MTSMSMSERRSLRIQEKKVVSKAQDAHRISRGSTERDLEEDEEEQETKRSENGATTNRSNANTSTNKKGRIPAQLRERQGLLEKLARDVPLDIILEIFCYLSPGDLLQLARSSKDLRGILMSKSSGSIWRIARENVRDLPPCPKDLNEPQYAHLLYDSYCHVCNHKGRCDNVLWSFRMRCCRNCIPSFFPPFDLKFLESQPSELRNCQDILPVEFIPGDGQVHTRLAAQLKAEFETLSPTSDRSAWLAEKKADRKARESHGELCEMWLQGRLDERARELSHIREQRKEAILVCLDGIGWCEEAKIIMSGWSVYLGCDEFSNHKSVRQSKKLTEYGWNSIKDELVQILSTCKAKRLSAKGSQNPIIYQRYVDLTKEYKRTLSESDLREPFPALGYIITRKVFKDFIWDIPHDEYLGNDFFRLELSERLPGIIDEWRPTKIQEAFFKCSGCRTDMHYPQMFYHDCCFRERETVDRRFQAYTSAFACDFIMTPWTSGKLIFDEDKSQKSRVIIRSCSLDPATTTIEGLHSVDPIIECMSCDSTYGRIFARWPIVFQDGHQNHTLRVRINSVGEETSRILASEPVCDQYMDILCCVHCNKSLAVRDLFNHLEDFHRVYTKQASSIKAAQEHWYWNPCWSCGHHSLHQVFRYKVSNGATQP
ncbi:hypothetical protein BT96DRAFT_988249 [Gymnopus androsaceus JB14]|uniref:F-box domain-containing protein n=1 Tax=Gymnopus androsaceus JB14 TaxID=1447944 RepID=A0A6A4I5A9_9AGAR|nr:hypothetical protein BT96DRAFT_988249 [Gymnopus androsaceus JB14]